MSRLQIVISALLIATFGCTGQRAVPNTQQEDSLQEESGTSSGAAGESPTYVRSVNGINVTGPNGTPYQFPFLGGLNVPRPSFVDIDGDADLDLFVQESTGELMFFENVGTPLDPELEWRTDSYGSLNIGEWYRFIDIDGDGDQDILAEKPYSYMALIRNAGTATSADWVISSDSLRDAAGVPIFSDRQNIPNVNDLDCDGRLDLFIGRVDGTVRHMEANSTGGETVPRFVFQTDRFEDIEIVGELQGSKHGANTMTFYDYDLDGDRDLFWGDFFEPGLLLIQNSGTCANPVLQNQPVPFPRNKPLATSGYNNAVFADLDGDNKNEMYVGVLGGAFNPNTTASDNLYQLVQNDSPDNFSIVSKRFLNGIDLGTESHPTFADLDADGDLDMILSNKIDTNNNKRSSVVVFQNTGSAAAPSFQQVDTLKLHDAYHHVPAFGDLDDDGDLDMIVGTWAKGIAYYRNDGTAEQYNFVEVDKKYLTLTRGSNAAPALVDVDEDGDLDLFIGESSGDINFFRNTGSAAVPAFVLESEKVGDIDVGRRSAPTFADVDGDGELEMIVGRDRGAPLVFKITGTSPMTFSKPVELPVELPEFNTPALVDIDGDGDLDLFSGNIGGGLLYFVNTAL